MFSSFGKKNLLKSPRRTAAVCQLCGTENATQFLKYQDLKLWQCSICDGLVTSIENAPDAASIYDESYFHGGEYLDYTAHQHVHDRNSRMKWRLIQKFAPQPVRLFEIGCAYGFFIDYVLKNGAAEARGVDVSREAVRQAIARFGPWFSLGSDEFFKKANVIAMWDVLEHLPEPFSELKKYLSNALPGTVLALTTVDSGSLSANLRGRHWRQIHPPTHLNYPTRKSLQLAATHLGCEVLYQKSFSPFRALEVYLRAALLGAGWLPSRVRYSAWTLNLGDLQAVVLRKI